MSLLIDAARLSGKLELLFPDLAAKEEVMRMEREHAEAMAALKTPATVTPAPNPRKAGRNLKAGTGTMFRALAAVVSTTSRTEMMDASNHKRLVEKVLSEYDDLTDTPAHAHYERYLIEFFEEYARND